MKESVMQRRLRLVMLTAVVLCVILAFYYQTLKFGNNQTSNSFDQKVSVIRRMTDSQNPLVAVAKMHEQKPILLLYNIDVLDNYKFETVNVVELKTQPEAMVAEEPLGVWIKLEGNWYFFDMNLQSRQKDDDETILINKSVQFKMVEDRVVVYSTNGTLLWSERFQDTPVSIHSLSRDNKLWLIVFKDDIIIYKYS
ncbi:hypothetical protein [Bacillus sp. Marseille-P3661]|uniref:hypothetical protein n=1 Tax=Bacillus sp. Marseille-P3661 TaxID=1936234 RepID=UPI00115A258C|nr:hypothetical protein [Bacillus sp. Marseille-P3661]